ncbi:hypothetical protein QC762_400220 [Podospora pseudocomata]|uniref:Ribonuclease H n=1 Tax=Podospora pseudocomata TaxID=2093779 RepID=A0ABR0GEE7_9PEZI|nr:hypothetical protein QC762_400220 [Podospora pseudocomata]
MPPKPKKFYGVRVGIEPGVYESWEECQKVIAVSGAVHKSFLSRDEAAAWVDGAPAAPGKITRFYAVARGHKPGVYTDWDSAQMQTTGFTRPVFRKFDTRAEAEDYLGAYPAGSNQAQSAKSQPTRKRGLEIDEEEEVVLPRKKSKAPSTDGKITMVYTDGAPPGNGKAGACGGVGVWFGADDPRNVSERLAGPLQTNQRAELTAILRALQLVDLDSPIDIRTDSQYSIDCVTKWYVSWVKKGWKTAGGTPVKNADLVKAIRDLMEDREAKGTITILTKVVGHSGDYGNDQADRLAVLGAQLPALDEKGLGE